MHNSKPEVNITYSKNIIIVRKGQCVGSKSILYEMHIFLVWFIPMPMFAFICELGIITKMPFRHFGCILICYITFLSFSIFNISQNSIVLFTISFK
jgi:hypothetical protein